MTQITMKKIRPSYKHSKLWSALNIIRPTSKLISYLSIWAVFSCLLGITTIENSIVRDSVPSDIAFSAPTLGGKPLFRKCTTPESSIPWPFHKEEQYRRFPKTPSFPTSPVSTSLLNPHLRCGMGLVKKKEPGFFDFLFGADMGFLEYFETVVKQTIIQPILEQEGCHDMVVFGAALGPKYIKYMTDRMGSNERVVDPDSLLKLHGRCFFMFVEHDEKSSERPIAKQLGHYWLIPLRKKYLYYDNDRRNVKLLKYMGHYAFLNYDVAGNPTSPSPRTIIWQDAKFFRSIFVDSMPRDYNTILRPNTQTFSPSASKHSACLTAMGLPISASTFGASYEDNVSRGIGVSSYKRPRYKHHCKTIVDAVVKRPNVTDSIKALTEQCEMYMQYVDEEKQQMDALKGEDDSASHSGDDDDNEEETDSLNLGLIDTAFLVWNESTQQCRKFNAKLRCTMLDQLQCHSDRDQVLFPLVVHRLLTPQSDANDKGDYSLKAIYYNAWKQKSFPVDKNWIPHAHDLDFVDRNSFDRNRIATDDVVDGGHDNVEQVYLRIRRSACHWYSFEHMPNQPLGERSCGHYIWLKDNLEQRHPSLAQELQIAAWSGFLAGLDYDSKALAKSETKQSSLAIVRGNIDIIGAPFAANFHRCTSPEYDTVPWTFQEETWDAAEKKLSCGTTEERLSPFHQKLKETILDPKVKPLAMDERCSDWILFGVDFEKQVDTYLLVMDDSTNNKDNLWTGRNDCYFMFVLKENLPYEWRDFPDYPSGATFPLNWGAHNQTVATGSASMSGSAHYWLVPIERDFLPYESMQRNEQLFKYSGQFFFPSAKNIVYQDVSMLERKFHDWHPIDYEEIHMREHESCLTVFALPLIKSNLTVGNQNATDIEMAEDFYPGHCKELINSLDILTYDGKLSGYSRDPASTASLVQQCDAYIQYVYKRELDIDILDQGLADTRFMSWNEDSEFCRNANAKLRCTILDQMHCHSAKDSLVVPFALYVSQIGLGSTTEYEYTKDGFDITRGLVNTNFTKRNHDLYFLREELERGVHDPVKRDTVKIIRETHHWMNVSSCTDDATFRYKNNKQTCEWAGEKLKRCNWKKEPKRVRHYCPQTCNLCSDNRQDATVAITMATPKKGSKISWG